MNERRIISNEVLLGEVCQMLSQGKRVKLRAKGNSMRPFIVGDEDLLVLAPPTQLRKYDVVLARVEGKRAEGDEIEGKGIERDEIEAEGIEGNRIEGVRSKKYRYVIHRIIGINEERFTLMGDGNLYAIEECSLKEIFGVVESVIHDGKECRLNSYGARFWAIAWRILLPLRRLKSKISILRIKICHAEGKI